jgi:hypothetical protein
MNDTIKTKLARVLCAVLLAASLAACGGGQDEGPATAQAAMTSHSVTLSAVPSGSGPWTVSYQDVQRLVDACFPSADVVTFTNRQPDGRSLFYVADRFVGDAPTLVAALPACPS